MPENEPFALGYHLVAFLDLLGQGDELDKIQSLPNNAAERAATIRVLQRTAGRVLDIRKAFDALFQELTKGATESFLSTLPAEQRARVASARKLRVSNRGVSDSFIVSVPLEERDQHPYTAAVGVFASLYGIAGIALTALAGGPPLRGGIDVGLAINLRPDEVYGPVLRCAYALESKKASYPRILIGPSLLDYLETFTARTPRDRLDDLAIVNVKVAQRLICFDPEDQLPMVHLVSPALFEIAPGMKETEKTAREQSKLLLEQFRTSGDSIRAAKYERLEKYFAAYPLQT